MTLNPARCLAPTACVLPNTPKTRACGACGWNASRSSPIGGRSTSRGRAPECSLSRSSPARGGGPPSGCPTQRDRPFFFGVGGMAMHPDRRRGGRLDLAPVSRRYPCPVTCPVPPVEAIHASRDGPWRDGVAANDAPSAIARISRATPAGHRRDASSATTARSPATQKSDKSQLAIASLPPGRSNQTSAQIGIPPMGRCPRLERQPHRKAMVAARKTPPCG